jgi:hypothetical protein
MGFSGLEVATLLHLPLDIYKSPLCSACFILILTQYFFTHNKYVVQIRV